MGFAVGNSLLEVPETELAACNFGQTTQCEEAEEDDKTADEFISEASERECSSN